VETANQRDDEAHSDSEAIGRPTGSAPVLLPVVCFVFPTSALVAVVIILLMSETSKEVNWPIGSENDTHTHIFNTYGLK